MSRPLIAITMGDAAAIGPELIVKVLSDPTMYDRCKPFVVGDLLVMRDTAAMLHSAMTFQPGMRKKRQYERYTPRDA